MSVSVPHLKARMDEEGLKIKELAEKAEMNPGQVRRAIRVGHTTDDNAKALQGALGGDLIGPMVDSRAVVVEPFAGKDKAEETPSDVDLPAPKRRKGRKGPQVQVGPATMTPADELTVGMILDLGADPEELVGIEPEEGDDRLYRGILRNLNVEVVAPRTYFFVKKSSFPVVEVTL